MVLLVCDACAVSGGTNNISPVPDIFWVVGANSMEYSVTQRRVPYGSCTNIYKWKRGVGVFEMKCSMLQLKTRVCYKQY